jgi:hypothetical protein
MTTAQDALQAIGVLTRSTTHDLNNQIAAILTFADLILEVLPKDHGVRAEVEEIRLAGKRAIMQSRELDRMARKLAPAGHVS